jgi:hypothetical protein
LFVVVVLLVTSQPPTTIQNSRQGSNEGQSFIEFEEREHLERKEKIGNCKIERRIRRLICGVPSNRLDFCDRRPCHKVFKQAEMRR